jgi:hypothetical protein
MSRLKHLANDLPEFFGEKPDVVAPLPAAELQLNDDTAAFLAKNPEARALCARIRYGKSCGFAASGTEAFVVNARNDKSVRATVRVNWRQGIDQGQYDRVFTIPPGSEAVLGCTRSGNIPVTEYTFQVVGCEVL